MYESVSGLDCASCNWVGAACGLTAATSMDKTTALVICTRWKTLSVRTSSDSSSAPEIDLAPDQQIAMAPVAAKICNPIYIFPNLNLVLQVSKFNQRILADPAGDEMLKRVQQLFLARLFCMIVL